MNSNRLPGNTDEMLDRAYKLAHFILGDKRLALTVAISSMTKLEAASNIQARRMFYRKTRTKPQVRRVSSDDIQLLQRLVYVESELYERLQENDPSSLSPDDLLIRFVKHLVRITTKRSSLYVAVGICRILYGYTTEETMRLHDFSCDLGQIKESHQYRRCKRLLLEEMRRRFSAFIEIEVGERGEDRIVREHSLTSHQDSLVRQCLNAFTPWGTTCEDSSRLAPTGHEPSLFWDQEIRERKRFHQLIHPACFSSVIEELRIQPHAASVPKFFGLASTASEEWRWRLHSPLAAQEKSEAHQRIAEEMQRRTVSLG
jgi:hypothetical protein